MTEENTSDDNRGTPPVGEREPFIQTNISEEDMEFEQAEPVSAEEVFGDDFDITDLQEDEPSFASMSKEDVLQEVTFRDTLKSAAMLVSFGVAGLLIAFATGFDFSSFGVDQLVSLATSPLNSFSIGAVSVQYSIFVFASAFLSPLGVLIAEAAGVQLMSPDMEKMMEIIPFTVPYISFQGGMEEVVFRGIPFVVAGFIGLGEGGLLVALVIGTIPWVLFHESGQYVNTAVLGAFFVLVWWGGYWQAGIIIHALHNLVAGSLMKTFS